MKKTFYKPEMKKVEIYLEENIASSQQTWESWVGSTYRAWDPSENCTAFVSGPQPRMIHQQPAISEFQWRNRDASFYDVFRTLLTNCDLGIYPGDSVNPEVTTNNFETQVFIGPSV